MTRRYEIVYIFDSALDEAQVTAALDKHHALLKSKDHPDPVKNVNHWGKRTLAYPIDNAQVGYYAVADFHTDPSLLPEFERALKLDDSIIRYLTVLNEGEVPRPMPHPSESDDRDGDERRPRRDRSESHRPDRPDRPAPSRAEADTGIDDTEGGD